MLALAGARPPRSSGAALRTSSPRQPRARTGRPTTASRMSTAVEFSYQDCRMSSLEHMCSESRGPLQFVPGSRMFPLSQGDPQLARRLVVVPFLGHAHPGQARPSTAPFASCSVRRALLIPQVNPGSIPGHSIAAARALKSSLSAHDWRRRRMKSAQNTLHSQSS